MAKKLKCPECSRSFDRAPALGAHRWGTHGIQSKKKAAKAHAAAAVAEPIVAAPERPLGRVVTQEVLDITAKSPARRQIEEKLLQINEAISNLQGERDILQKALDILRD